MLELDVAPVDIAQPCEALEQRSEVWGFLFGATRMPEIADPGNFAARLRPSDAWHRNYRTAHEREEITPSHESLPRLTWYCTAPPSSVMNVRLLIRSPRRRGRAPCPAWPGQAPSRW